MGHCRKDDLKSMNKKYRICCQQMLRLINDVETLILYSSKIRFFSLGTIPEGYHSKKFGFGIGYCLQYCPLCGKDLPVEIDDYREEILEREFGLKLYTENDEINPIVPSEFLTDAWWIARQHYPDFPTKYKTWRDREIEEILNDHDLRDDEKKEKIDEILEEKKKDDAQDLGGFCCYRFKIQVEGWCDDCQGNSCSEYPIIYEAEKRRYRLTNIPPRYLLRDKFWKRQPRRELFVNIFYCPHCGQKLKESLASRWYREIHEKFGVFDILSKSQMAKVPQKYLTDEWWKELGL